MGYVVQAFAQSRFCRALETEIVGDFDDPLLHALHGVGRSPPLLTSRRARTHVDAALAVQLPPPVVSTGGVRSDALISWQMRWT